MPQNVMLLANVVWPALYLNERYYSWPIIGLSLLIEILVLLRLTRQPPARCAWMALAANAVSALIGFFAFIWLGLAWEFVVSYTIYQIFPLGTFNPFGWAATTALAALLSCSIECLVLRYGFKLPITKKFYGVFFAANLVTAALALLSLLAWPVQV